MENERIAVKRVKAEKLFGLETKEKLDDYFDSPKHNLRPPPQTPTPVSSANASFSSASESNSSVIYSPPISTPTPPRPCKSKYKNFYSVMKNDKVRRILFQDELTNNKDGGI